MSAEEEIAFAGARYLVLSKPQKFDVSGKCASSFSKIKLVKLSGHVDAVCGTRDESQRAVQVGV